ncbi:MAG: hypothetical protein J3K34DRAFT_455894 [Monoraphidium minutum]|nr:MAG: hypothetical protein J3K34DRAFT_455894 [Monoraphidium minutum]
MQPQDVKPDLDELECVGTPEPADACAGTAGDNTDSSAGGGASLRAGDARPRGASAAVPLLANAFPPGGAGPSGAAAPPPRPPGGGAEAPLHRPPLPGRRGRGRPPMVTAYSRTYARVKENRASAKAQVDAMVAEVASKMRSAELLAAENEVLTSQEGQLQRVIAHRDKQLRALEGARHRGAAAGASEPPPQSSSGPGNAFLAAGAAAGAAAARGAAEPSVDADGPWGGGPDHGYGMSDAEKGYHDVWLRYVRDHVQHARATRLRPDGTVAPLPPGDPRKAKFMAALQEATLWPVYRLLRHSFVCLDTLEDKERPPDFHQKVAKGMRMTPEQEAGALAVYDFYLPAFKALEAETAALKAELEAAGQAGMLDVASVGLVARDEEQLRQMFGGGGGRGGGGVLEDQRNFELASGLWRSINKQWDLWNTCTARIMEIMGEATVVHWFTLSWPHLVDPFGHLSCYRKEVLGLD